MGGRETPHILKNALKTATLPSRIRRCWRYAILGGSSQDVSDLTTMVIVSPLSGSGIVGPRDPSAINHWKQVLEWSSKQAWKFWGYNLSYPSLLKGHFRGEITPCITNITISWGPTLFGKSTWVEFRTSTLPSRWKFQAHGTWYTFGCLKGSKPSKGEENTGKGYDWLGVTSMAP